MTKNVFILLALAACLFSSCGSPNLAYFSDLHDGQTVTEPSGGSVRFCVGDKIAIVVKSRDPQLSSLFNLPLTSQTIGSTAQQDAVITGGQGIMCYTIDSNGEIDFPVVGKLKILNLTREQVASHVKQELVRRNLVNDPVVTVEYAGLPFNVLGEVAHPGRYYFDRDRMTLLDALSKAGDLTINARRDNVMVLREQDGQRVTYRVDLKLAGSLYNSPAYYLQQNDVIYVEPTNKRERESTATGNTFFEPAVWISLSSLLLTLGVLVFK